MPLITSEQIIRLFQQGEQEVSIEKPFLVDRVSIAVTAGTNQFILPDYVLNIRRVSFQGYGLDPLPRRNQRENFQSATQQGTPFWYIFNNIGLNTLQLFPTPTINLSVAPDGTDLFLKSAIRQYFIVEYYRLADGINFAVPYTLRRQLLKKYVATNVFMTDNQNINVRLSRYFGQRWAQAKNDFYDLIDDLYNKPRRLVINDFQTYNWFPGSPVLPISRFGIGVNEGE